VRCSRSLAIVDTASGNHPALPRITARGDES
jgi:hypothetical protein